MPKVITLTELQKQTRKVLDYARIAHDVVVVETQGQPVAVILSYDEYQDYADYKLQLIRRSAQLYPLQATATQNTDHE